MNSLIAPIARIGLRVLAGAMIGIGFSESAAGFVNSEVVAGGVVLVMTEGWYILAKRFGWKT